jgi:S-adenosylmethionine uptake transporter
MSPLRAAIIGCLSLSLGMLMFGIGNVFIKLTTADLPVAEVLFYRSFFGVLCVVLYLFLTNKLPYLKSHNLRLQLFRGAIGFVALYFLFLCFDLLPLVQATVLTFSITLFITLFSVPLLKEKIGVNRGIAVLVGFAGVTLASIPEQCTDLKSLVCNLTLGGVIAALASTSIDSIVMILGKFLSKKDKPITSVFYHTGIIAVIAGLSFPLGHLVASNHDAVPQFLSGILPSQWVAPTMHHLMLLFILGFVSVVGHTFITFAYSVAPAVVISPMFYTLIVWGALFGNLFFGESINTNLWLGTPLIVLSGLYIIYQESKMKVPHIPETDASSVKGKA